MDWIIYALIASFLWSIVDIIDKYVTDNEVKDPITATVVCGLGSCIILMIIAGYMKNIYIPLDIAIFSIVAGAIFRFSVIFFYWALSKGEVSRIVPIVELNPIFVVIIALLFLGERFSGLTYLGIILSLLSALLISNHNPSLKIKLETSSYIALLTSVMFAIRTIMVKSATIMADPWAILFWMGLGQGIVALFLLAFHHPHVTSKIRLGIKHLSIGLTFNVSAFILFTLALSQGSASLVSALRLSTFFFVFLISTLLSFKFPDLFHEPLTKKILIQKSTALVLLTIGLIAIMQ